MQQFNSADSLEVKEVMEETAFKMLERIKVRLHHRNLRWAQFKHQRGGSDEINQ